MNPMEISQKFEEAAALHRAGELRKAEDIYLQIHKALPAWEAVNLNLAALYTQQKLFHKALKYNELALKANPSSQDAMRNQYTILLGLERKTEALEILRVLVEKDPGSGHIRFNLGTLLFQLGEVNEALEALQLATKLQPEMPEAFQNLGTVQMELEDLEAAEQSFQTALRLRPGYPLALESLAKLAKAKI